MKLIDDKFVLKEINLNISSDSRKFKFGIKPYNFNRYLELLNRVLEPYKESCGILEDD